MGCEECANERDGYEIYTNYGYDPKKNPYFHSSKFNALSAEQRLKNLSLPELLEWKFRQQYGLSIQFSEISQQEFNQALQINPFVFNILEKTKLLLNSINYEKDVVFNNINPLKIFEPSGEPQYYHGSFNKKGQCHGKGIWTKDGNVYYGNFKNDEFDGNGLFISPIGDYYFGEWKHSQLNGEGYLVVKNKIVYKGKFYKNKKNGNGEEILPNGDSYVGSFFDGQKNGKGSYIFNNGSMYNGNFKDSKYNGYGEMNWNLGKSYTGNFKDGKINSMGRMNFGDGSSFYADSNNSDILKSGTYTWKNGASFRGYWDNNIKGSGIYTNSMRGTNEYINLV